MLLFNLRFFAIVSSSGVVASILVRFLLISGWNLAFVNYTAKALAPMICAYGSSFDDHVKHCDV
jgi:hypothetical protein